MRNRFAILMVVSLCLEIGIGVASYLSLPITDFGFLALLILSVLGVIVSIHGLVTGYLRASFYGALVSFVPFAALVVLDPGKFGLLLMIPGLLIFFGVVFVVALLVGLSLKRLRVHA